ncbi:MAG TPA: hypothetical protein PL035_00285 [Bacillota bacterium]|nr:hypothetical protein [Bacillota bacterium]HQC35505.1 hypothetical protein [Bacillota bacterium]
MSENEKIRKIFVPILLAVIIVVCLIAILLGDSQNPIIQRLLDGRHYHLIMILAGLSLIQIVRKKKE